MSSTTLLVLLSLCGTCYCVCPEAWISNDESCYTFIENPLSWTDAITLCKLRSSHLVEITSPSENTFVKNLLLYRKVPIAWLGINDSDQEGSWVSATSNQTVTFQSWAKGEPNNLNDQDCGTILDSGNWDDISCDPTTKFPSFCKRSA